MLNWMEILKLNQVSISSSALDTRDLPEEKKDNECCMKAANLFVEIWNKEFDMPEYEWRKKKDAPWNKKLTVQILMDHFTYDDYNFLREPVKYKKLTPDEFCANFRETLEKNVESMLDIPDKEKFEITLQYWEECEK